MKGASPWVRMLACHAPLSLEEQHVLEEVSAVPLGCAPQDSLAKAGEIAERVYVVLSGLACRFKLLPDGRRQILAYLLPGDMCDPRQLLLPQIDHSICVLMPSQVATLGPPALQRLERYPNIRIALERYALTQQGIAREWLLNVGHRTAFERIGHLICEVFTRLEAVGLTQDHSFDFPLTQSELGDTLALSSVHVNRTLMELRRLKLVTFQNRQVKIHDFVALRVAAGFDPAYLNLHAQSSVTVPARA